MKRLVLLSIILSGFIANAQTYDIAQAETRLFSLLETLRNSTTDADKATNNQAFKSELSAVLKNKESFEHPFTSLASSVGFINSSDKMVRIVNWNIEQEDKSQRYFGFVQHYDKRGRILEVTELVEDVFGLSRPDDVVDAASWYGALYYKIIPVKKGSRTIYTVLGWDGNNTMSNIKLVDAMYINGSSVKFGQPIFKIGKEIKKRLFYEHSEDVTMVLRYEDDRKRIMMDHLAPESPNMTGHYSFYVPDLSYDALKYEDSKWVLHEDIIGVNNHDAEKEKYVYTKDPKTGKVVKRKIKNAWQDPSDPAAPAGGNEHVATTPEEPSRTEKTKEPKVKEPKADKKDKRDPSELSIMEGVKKKKKRKNRTN